jgi:hypothetical protein
MNEGAKITAPIDVIPMCSAGQMSNNYSCIGAETVAGIITQ